MDAFLDILRELVSDKLFTFIAGFIFGVLACWRFCPAYWQWRTHRFDVEREDRLRKEQEEKERKYEETKRAFHKECAERGIDYSFSHGVYLSTDEVLYCPSCYSFYKLSEMTPNSKSRMLYCCECGKIISMEPKRIF